MKRLFFIIIVIAGCTLNAQNQFTNGGNVKVHSGGSISFFGNFINNGTFVDSGQVVTLAGTQPQQIGGSSTTTFKNLALNNAAGSYLSSNQAISRELLISSGTFSSTGYDLTLISDANGTARIAPILGDFTGNITMQRYMGPGPNSWRFLAAPVSGVTINDWQDDFITSGFPGSGYPNFPFVSVYTYDETVGGTSDFGYNGAASASDPIVPGAGYWCYIGPVPLTVDVTGPPVKFTHNFQVSYTPSAGAAEDGYVMIGNPYPSPIDWSSTSWTKTNVNNAIYIWNPALQQYASWVSGTATNGGSNLIASSQSFWIQANGANPALSCNENIKASSNTPFIRPASQPVFTTLKLNLKGNNYQDETILRFGNGAGNGYDDAFDARKLFSSNAQVPGLSTLDSTLKDMSVNSLPPVSNLTYVPLRTLVGISGSYNLSIDSSSSIPDGFCIVLEDLLTGTQTNLSSFSTYSFNIADTTKAPRFLIHVTAPPQAKAMATSCYQHTDGKAIATGKGTGPWNYLWYNSANLLIQQTSNSFQPDTLYNLGAGNYTVLVSNADGLCGFFANTLEVTQPAPVYAGFVTLNNNLFAGNADSLILQNTSLGAARFEWTFGDGSAVDSSYTPAPHYYTTPGQYEVRMVARYNTCSDTLTKTVTVLKPVHTLTGINEYSPVTMPVIFPNPGNGVFHVKLNTTGQVKYRIEVYNLQGQNIYQSALESELSVIRLQGFDKGVYLYRLYGGDVQQASGKLVIQ
jgi:hypothetical protein